MQDMLQQEGVEIVEATVEDVKGNIVPLTLGQENLPAIRVDMTPAQAVDFAREAAKVLVDVVEQCELAVVCSNRPDAKKHIMLEGWSTVAKFYGCTIKCTSSQPVGDPDTRARFPGFYAKAEVIDKFGNVIGEGDGYCMRDEGTWKNRPNYALASMAQTRAASKAARIVFSWVVVLAGYNPTPSDEMPDEMHKSPPPAGAKPVVNTTPSEADPFSGGFVNNPKAVSGLFDYLKRQKIEKDEFGQFLLETRKCGDITLTRAPIESTESGKPRWDKLSMLYFNTFKGNKEGVIHAFFNWKIDKDKDTPVDGSTLVKSDQASDQASDLDIAQETAQNEMF